MMNYSYDLCGILVGIRMTYDQPHFHAVKDAAFNDCKSGGKDESLEEQY